MGALISKDPAISEPTSELLALLSLCSLKNEIQSLEAESNVWQKTMEVTKIREGSFASILRFELKSTPGVYSIWKLMPLESDPSQAEPGTYAGTSVRDAVAEVKALALMSDSPGFVEMRSATVLKGCLTPFLRQIFDDWIEKHPEDDWSCGHDGEQLWLLIEMTDAGTDLETLLKDDCPKELRLNKQKKGSRLTLHQAWDIFFLTAEALAHGEQHSQFEHRDLHPGNVCIKEKTSDCESPISTSSELSDGLCIQPHTELEVTVIDYTFSRARLAEGEILANSMQDKDMFKQHSEIANDQQQYDIYGQMRMIVEGSGNSSKDTSGMWELYFPTTNVTWLWHILTILLQETEGFGENGASYKIKDAKKLARQLADLRIDLAPKNRGRCDYLSATDIVRSEMWGKKQMLDFDIWEDDAFEHEARYMQKLRRQRSKRLKK